MNTAQTYCKENRNDYARLDIETAKEGRQRPEPPFGAEGEFHGYSLEGHQLRGRVVGYQSEKEGM